MKNYLMLVLAAVLLAVTFVIQKIYQKDRGSSLKDALAFSMLTGLFSAVIFFVVCGFRFEITVFSFLMALLCALLGRSYVLLGFWTMRQGSLSQYSLFLMTGGMTVPYVWGILFLGEPFSWVRTFALLLMIVAIAYSNYTPQKANWKLTAAYLTIFFLNGFVSVTNKMHQIESVFPKVGTNAYSLLCATLCVVASTMVYVCLPKPKEPASTTAEKPLVKKNPIAMHWVVLLVFASSAVSALSSYLMLQGAVELPATVLYPFITGGSIIFTALADWLCFKTKLTARTWIGVGLCFIGTVLFL